MAATASAPASSGNLGPGFDTLAIAFDLRCHVEAEESTAWVIEENGVIGELAEDDLIARAITAAVQRPMRVGVRNEIPRARGLGSSSAVAAAAATAALRATGTEPTRERVFEIVADLEGHGDNAAAAVYGGLVAVAGGRISALELHPSIVPLLAVPEARLSTKRARSALPESVAMPVVVRSLGRLAFLIEGMRRADPALLEHARGDELHELPRAALSPLTAMLIGAALGAGAMHASWSGAGPAVLILTTAQGRDAVRAALDEVMAGGGTTIEPAVDRIGLS
jgi:homoserine kinase